MLVQLKRSVPYMTFRAWTKALKRRAKLSAYRGNEYQCPICAVTLRAFESFASVNTSFIETPKLCVLKSWVTRSAPHGDCPPCPAK